MMSRDSFTSYWVTATPSPGYAPLTGDHPVDVAVIGAGIVGITTAYLLAIEGMSVAVLDRGEVAGGVSGFTTAKITSSHGLVYARLIRSFGIEGARAYGRSNEQAKERIASLVEELDIGCGFERADNYVYTSSPEKISTLKQEVEAARSVGLPATLTTETELPFAVEGAVRFSGQAQFDPRRYLLRLAAEIETLGGRIFERSAVTGVEEGSPSVVRTEHGTVRANDVIVATHMPILDRGLFFTKVHPHRSYALAGHAATGVGRGMYLSVDQPTRSMRSIPAGTERLLLVGGEGHKTGTDEATDGHYERLESWAEETFGMEVRHRWATQDNVSIDGVPYVGRLTRGSQHVFTATGFGKWGMTNGTVAAGILADEIAGRPNTWAWLFDSKRIKPKVSARRFVTENAGVAARMVSDHVTKRGNPRCTHLGCVLRVNRAEGTWDCPCHGSRFGPGGEVLHGPATEPLEAPAPGALGSNDD